MGFPCGSAGKEFTCSVGDLGLIPGLGRFLGERKGYPLQYSGLDNFVDCIDQGVTKSWTRLTDFHSQNICIYTCIINYSFLTHFPEQSYKEEIGVDEHDLYPAAAKWLQSCPTLCNPRDGSPPGSPIAGILQARILEWVAISFSNA